MQKPQNLAGFALAPKVFRQKPKSGKIFGSGPQNYGVLAEFVQN
jgi:hypothetical protein